MSVKTNGRPKQRPDYDPLGDEVALAYFHTTAPQRAQVAEDWVHGDQIKHKRFAELLGIDPDGLLLASLLDAEHPSICAPNGRPMGANYGVLFKKVLAYKPVHNYPETVDNSLKSVDKPVESLVENDATYPQSRREAWLCG